MIRACLVAFALLVAGPAAADVRDDYLELVERGWDYDFRDSARGNAGRPPPSFVMARTMAPRTVCLIGEAPHPVMAETLARFRDLLREIFGTAGPVTKGGNTISACDSEASVFIRFYSTLVPNEAFNADIAALNARFDLGLSGRQQLRILSPGQAVTMFGIDGQITHLSLLEPARPAISKLERDFYRSVLIEELYQSYSFGIDIFKMGSGGPYLSKLQESPVNLRFLDWTSSDYMAGLLSSNPNGLCHFDAMMLHALASYLPVDEGDGPFTEFVAAEFDTLFDLARGTASDAAFASLFDPDCAAPPDR